MPKPRHYPALLAVCGLIGACYGPDQGGEPSISSEKSKIIFGQPDPGHPFVGMLQSGTVGTVGLCTATLIGSRTVLTAAHCIRTGLTHIFHLNGAKYTAQSMKAHEQWNPNDNSYPNDIGLLVLASAPTGVTPSPIAKNPPTVGLQITLVGFGESSEGKKDTGQKRTGVNTVSEVSATRFGFAGSGNGKASTCEGDSGGPAFAKEGGRDVQIGITSAGVSPCGRMAWDTRVDAYRAWIIKNANGDVADPSDAEAPKVTITEPQNNANVQGTATVKAQVTDNVGVKSVDLLLGGKKIKTLNKAPYNFTVSLNAGSNTIQVDGYDGVGNKGSATITVTVGSSSKKAFGEACSAADQCQGNICAEQGGKRFCTQLCDPGNCPNNGKCLPAGNGKSVCVPTGPLNNDIDAGLLVGSCTLSGDDKSQDLWPILVLLALGFVFRRRRQS